MKTHQYQSTITWTGNKGSGTSDYLSYSRDHVIAIENKPDLLGSSDTAFRGDGTKHNPEDMLLASLSVCHMLWYLHLASNAGIVVTGYRDDPIGHGETLPNGAGRFIAAVLRPKISVQEGADLEFAGNLHHKVHDFCFIARSVNFPVSYEPTFNVVAR